MPHNPAVLPVFAQALHVVHSFCVTSVEILIKPLSKLLLAQDHFERYVAQPSKEAIQAGADRLGDDSFEVFWL